MRHLFLIAVLTATFSGCGLDNIQWAEQNEIVVNEISMPLKEFDEIYGKDKLAVVDDLFTVINPRSRLIKKQTSAVIVYRGRMIDDLCIRDAEYGKIRNSLEGYGYNKYAFPCARLEFGEWVEYGRVK